MAPNMATPRGSPMPLARVKVRKRNNRRGSRGSVARRSTMTKVGTRIAAATMSPTMVGEPQGYCVPPQVVASTIAVIAAVSTVAPTASMCTRLRLIDGGSTDDVTTRARMPRGKLI